MKKFFKISAIICAVGIVLVIAAVIIILFFIDPNDYKNEIAKAVHKATGRNLTITGNIELSVFPWLGLKLGAISMDNAPSFGKDPMATVQNADIKLRLFSLIHKKLDVKKISLNGLDISLVREKNGTTNWDDLAGKPGGHKPEKPGEQKSKDILESLAIADLELSNVNISFDDRTQGTYHKITNLSLGSDRIKLGKPCKLNLQFNIDSAKPKIKAGVNLKTVMNLLINEKQAGFDKTELGLVIDELNPEPQNKKAAISGTVDLEGDLLVNWNTCDFKAESLELKTAIKGGKVPEQAANMDLKALVNLNWKKQTLNITELDVSGTDKLTVRGAFSMAGFKQPKIRFDLDAGEIDISNYVPEKGKTKPGSEKKEPSPGEAFQLPDASGVLRIAGIKTKDASISDIYLNIDKGQKNKNSGKLDLRFNIASAKPEIRAGINVNTLINMATGKQIDLSNTRLNLKLDKFVPEQKSKGSGFTGSASLAGNMLVNLDSSDFKAHGLKLKAGIKGGQVPGGVGNLDLKADDIGLNWKKETLTVSGLDVSAYDMGITGNANASRLFSEPQIKSALNIAEFSPRKLMQILGAKAPETSDPNALNKASASISMTANKNSVNFSKLDIRVDQTTLRGTAQSDFKQPKIKFDLKVNEIDADRYRPSRPEKKIKKVKEVIEKKPPLDIKSLDLDGRLVVGNLKIFNIRSQDTVLKITSKDGLLQVDPFSAMLYGGKYTSRIITDLKKAKPRTALDLNLSDVQLGKLLEEIIGNDKVTGAASLKLSVSGNGGVWSSLRETLNGEASFSLKNGMIKGFQIIPESVIKQVLEHDPKKRIKDVSKHQKFKDITAKLNIRDGIVSNNDLALIAERLNIIGDGAVNLAKGEIDYNIKANLPGIPKIPFSIKGPFSDIKASLDTPEFIKELAVGIIKSPLDIGTGVLDVGSEVLEKGKEALGEEKGVKKVGKGVLGVGKGILDVGKGVLNVGKEVVDKDEDNQGAKDVGKGVKDVGKGVLDVGKGTVESIGGGLKKIIGEPEKDEKDKEKK
ncbi:MAG: AsmA family protein [Desulfobacterales bacterium]|nr:AsmA family protein [Desulfobacterales bacterium]